MSFDSLPNIIDVHSEPDLDQTALLDFLFEPSPAIHAALIPVIRTATYSNYPELIDACQIRLLSLAASTSSTTPSPSASNSSSFNFKSPSALEPPSTSAFLSYTSSRGSDPKTELLAVLGSHPRLGEKKITSKESAAEQAKLQAETSESESEELAKLNQEYEQTFPGLRYVVFVNGRGRGEIMEDMRARIARGDFQKEVVGALQAMCDIAKDRASRKPQRIAVGIR